MRIVLQRVREAAVHVPAPSGGAGEDTPSGGEEEVVGRIGPGLLLLVGIVKGDTDADADALARKIAALRIFPGRTPMDRTVVEVGGACLAVSQFTLAGSVHKGNRPGFDRAEDPARAEALYLRLVKRLRAAGLEVATGRFAARMQVGLVNDGPVTFVLDAEGGRVR
jgi:D-tyrosyl-tRNA(Tyr) deacylase